MSPEYLALSMLEVPNLSEPAYDEPETGGLEVSAGALTLETAGVDSGVGAGAGAGVDVVVGAGGGGGGDNGDEVVVWAVGVDVVDVVDVVDGGARTEVVVFTTVGEG